MRGIRTTHINPLGIIQQLSSPAASSQASWLCKTHVPHHRVRGTSMHNKPIWVYSNSNPFSTSRSPFQARVPQPVDATARLVADVSPGKLTPPESSAPVALETPERGIDESAFGYYFKVGRGYLSFYKTGLKNVYRNFVSSRELQKRIDQEGHGTITELVEKGKITRGEFQFVMRTRHDSRRIPLFALVLLICGEFTPLTVVFFSSIVPFTCRIPKQVLSDATKLHQRRSASFASLPPPPTTQTPTHTLSPPPSSNITTIPPALSLDHLSHKQLLHVATTLNLVPSLLSYIAFPYVLQWRVKRRIEYLELDDTLIEQFGGLSKLAHEGGRKELEWAATERGIDTLGKSEVDINEALSKWFQTRKKNGRVLPEAFFERR